MVGLAMAPPSIGEIQEVLDLNGSPFSGIVRVSASMNHSVCLKADGSVFSFGSNSAGQLGDGTTIQRNNPVQ